MLKISFQKIFASLCVLLKMYLPPEGQDKSTKPLKKAAEYLETIFGTSIFALLFNRKHPIVWTMV